jgi:hypothetical protein
MDGARLLTGGRIKTMDPGEPDGGFDPSLRTEDRCRGNWETGDGSSPCFKADKIDLEGRRVIPGSSTGTFTSLLSEGKMAVDLSGMPFDPRGGGKTEGEGRLFTRR